jgi:hypothetical protein
VTPAERKKLHASDDSLSALSHELHVVEVRIRSILPLVAIKLAQAGVRVAESRKEIRDALYRGPPP